MTDIRSWCPPASKSAPHINFNLFQTSLGEMKIYSANTKSVVSDGFPCFDSHTFREGAFSGLDSLEWLKLEDNAISALDGGDLFPASLKVFLTNITYFENAFKIHNHSQGRSAVITLANCRNDALSKSYCRFT